MPRHYAGTGRGIVYKELVRQLKQRGIDIKGMFIPLEEDGENVAITVDTRYEYPMWWYKDGSEILEVFCELGLMEKVNTGIPFFPRDESQLHPRICWRGRIC